MAALPCLLNAQQSDFHDEDLYFADIDSVFTASKFEQKITEAPARINIITADEIEVYGYRTLSEVLNTLPGFQVTDDHSYSYIGTRGFSVPGDYNSRVLMLIDGHRVNDNIYSGYIADNGLSVNINLIERIEMVRGTASSLYGNSAFFGVINIITKRGRDIQGTQVIATIGSQNTRELTLSYGQRFNNGMDVLISASHDESDGNDHFYFLEFDDPSTNNGYANNNDSGNNDSVFASIKYKGLTVTGSYQKQSKTNPTGAFDTVFNDDRTIAWEGTSYLDLKYQLLLDNGTDITARVFYDQYRYTSHYASDYSDAADLSVIEILKEKANGDWWGSEFLATNTFFTHHHITLGAEYRNSIKEQQYSWDSFQRFLDLDTDSHTWGVYLQNDIKLSELFSLNIGLRHDQPSNTDSTLNPRIAAIWSANNHTTVKLICGTSFRAPSPYEIYYIELGFHKIASDSLEPETVTSYELILEHQLSHNLHLVTSLYHNEIDKLIAITTDPSDGLLVIKNHNSAISKGLEIEFQGHWENGWQGATSYTYQNATNSLTNEKLINTPTTQIKLNFVSPDLMFGIKAGLNFQYEDDRLTINGNSTGSIKLINITLLKQRFLNGLDIAFGAYNLFDETYSQPGSEEHTQDQIKQYGRTFRLKIDYEF